MKRALRKFTDQGLAQFRRYLADLKRGSTVPPPFDLLVDPEASKPVKEQLPIENRKFATRLEMARYLDEALAEIQNDGIETDVYLWSWLSLFYFDQVCPVDSKGKRKPGRDYRHIPEIGFRYVHRHLLSGAYLVYTVYGLKDRLSKLLLSSPLAQESRVHHELATRHSMVTNVGIIEAAHILYYDEKADKPKRGIIVKKNKPGTF